MTEFTPIASTIGGMLLGVSASALLWSLGRMPAISSIVEGALQPRPHDASWRWLFLGGLASGGLAGELLVPSFFGETPDRATWRIVAAGLLVGFGARLGNGCTSGHGVCGIPRGSLRSIVATCTFMATAAITVWVARLWTGGGT